MQTFSCPACGERVFFENSQCTHCGIGLVFDGRALAMLQSREPGTPKGAEQRVTACANAAYGACNWVAEADAAGALCRACALNSTIPDLSDPANLLAWQAFETAKKRLIYSFLRFDLPFSADDFQGSPGLAIAFEDGAMTGHEGGEITVSLAEADAVERTQRQEHLDERYRTLLGHLRHESGHFYWDVLVAPSPRLDAFRELFGDERADYAEALERHHREGPPADWQQAFVSAYASSHPWEDWAETWAHYFHIVDVLDTAQSAAEAASGRLVTSWSAVRAPGANDPYRGMSAADLMAAWTPLSLALNDLSRSMGHDDFYPFVIPATAHAKFAFVHETIRAAAPRS